DVQLEVWLQGEKMERPQRICRSNARHLYWNVCQQLAHHTVNGCNLRPGDLLASGTISGPTPDSYGSLLELAWKGTKPLTFPDGESNLIRLDIIGERGSFGWVRPEHMEPTGMPTSGEVRARMRQQVGECLDLLTRMANGEGALCKVSMSVNDLGKIDLYQWL